MKGIFKVLLVLALLLVPVSSASAYSYSGSRSYSSPSYRSYSAPRTYSAPKTVTLSKPSTTAPKPSTTKPSTTTPKTTTPAKPAAPKAPSYKGKLDSGKQFRNSAGQTVVYRESGINGITTWLFFGWLWYNGTNDKCYDSNHKQVDCKEKKDATNSKSTSWLTPSRSAYRYV